MISVIVHKVKEKKSEKLIKMFETFKNNNFTLT